MQCFFFEEKNDHKKEVAQGAKGTMDTPTF
jgi:hypothetical protein